MSLKTFSKFYYGHTVTEDNQYLDFSEGGPEITAILSVGEYTLTDFAVEIQRALNDSSGALVYVVTVDRSTRKITITSTSNFELLVSTGSHLDASVFGLAGFTGADRTGDDSYEGDSASGFSYSPQFILQNHIAKEKWQQAAEASVNKAASGRVEVVSFGTEQFVQFQIRYSTDIPQTDIAIRNQLNGVANLEDFMQYIITRAPFEFIPDEDDPETFDSLMLDQTPDSPTATGYKIKELYDRNLPGYFETSILRARVI